MAGLFYVDVLPDAGEPIVVDGDEGFHAATVRRIRAGEELTLSDGAGSVGRCRVEEAARDGLRVRVLERWQVAPARPAVTVVQALPKSERSELAVELATEAGADELLAWRAGRCVARWEGARAAKGLRRWRAVARSASQQSRRAHIPAVDGVLSTADVSARIAAVTRAGGIAVALHDAAEDPVAELGLARAASVLLVVGPEGGIAPDELSAFTDSGARAVRLGPTVLRTSTAAAVALGALGVLTPRWT